MLENGGRGTESWIFSSSVGYSLLIKKENMISLQFDRVEIGNGPSFGCVLMKDFLEALAKKVKKNTASFDNFSRMYVPPNVPLKQKPGEPVRTVNLFKHIQVPPLSYNPCVDVPKWLPYETNFSDVNSI